MKRTLAGMLLVLGGVTLATDLAHAASDSDRGDAWRDSAYMRERKSDPNDPLYDPVWVEKQKFRAVQPIDFNGRVTINSLNYQAGVEDGYANELDERYRRNGNWDSNYWQGYLYASRAKEQRRMRQEHMEAGTPLPDELDRDELRRSEYGLKLLGRVDALAGRDADSSLFSNRDYMNSYDSASCFLAYGSTPPAGRCGGGDKSGH